jgi:hypothetical protein
MAQQVAAPSGIVSLGKPTPSASHTTVTNTTSSSAYSDIGHRIDAIEDAIRNLAVTVNKTSNGTSVPSTRRRRTQKAMTDEKAMEAAKRLFYHDHKKDEDILECVRNGLSQGNMLRYKVKKQGDTTTHVPNIHWMLVKDATDVRFEALTRQEQDVYIRRAWEEHAKKLATGL